MYTGSTPRQGVARLVEGWGALAQRYSPTIQAGLDPAWWVGEARQHIVSSLCEVGGPASIINLPHCVLMCFCKSSVCVQLKSQYACMPHSPTRRDPSLPGRLVRCARPARPNHPPDGQHPAAGCCPCTRWAETNYPSVINQLPAREPLSVDDCGNLNGHSSCCVARAPLRE